MIPIWFKGIVRLTQRIPDTQKFLVWNCYPVDREGGEPLVFRQILKKSNRDAINFEFERSCNDVVYICFPGKDMLMAFSIINEERGNEERGI